MGITSKIPAEILREVFLRAIDAPISNIQGNRFPWALNRVCKSWRSVFVTYPYLWTWITIDLAESLSRGQDLIAVNHCLSLFLERSRNYPLNISIHLPTEVDDENGPAFILIWQTFLSCSHRWRIVYLANAHESQFFTTLDQCTGATPILESLTIHSSMDIGYSDFTGSQIMPQLTRFTLRDPGAMFAVQKWSVPWMQLTHLVLKFEEISGVDQLYILFKQLRDIEELRLIVEGHNPTIDLNDFVHSSRTPQCLQHLRVLQVCCINILSLITAPSLSELYLEHSNFFYLPTDDDTDGEDIPRSFIQRSSCKIRKLTLFKISNYFVTPLVELFPDVVELCLTDGLMWMAHLQTPDYLPGLRVLDCTAPKTNAKYFMATLHKILELRNHIPRRCLAAPLAKVIFRSAFEDGEASFLVTTTDWASFESHVYVGSCCELNLTNFLFPCWCQRGNYRPAKNGYPNTCIAPSPSSSAQGASLNPGPMVNQQPVVSDMPFPPNFIQRLSNSLDDFESNIFRNDGDINFERDFGQWFNGDDVPLDMRSTLVGAPLNPGPTHLSSHLGSNIVRNDGDINFERDFGQWFNGHDVPPI